MKGSDYKSEPAENTLIRNPAKVKNNVICRIYSAFYNYCGFISVYLVIRHLKGGVMRFSSWSKFDLRDDIKNTKYPGIYAIAISANDISGTPFDYMKKIAYFGMTNAKRGLRGRLNDFNNTPRDKSGPGHGGAERFRYDFKDGEALAKKLYVAVCHFRCDVSSIARKDLETKGEVARAEYLAFAKYAELYGALPKYNDKQKSPKRKGTLSRSHK